jgi:phenylpyruvate tautomerase PptA (4-oxalocrotonate tautomerase family)
MPILEVDVVGRSTSGLARKIAAAAGPIVGRGHTWVIVRKVAQADYAEDAGGAYRPLLVKIMERRRPRGPRLKAEIRALTAAIAKACRHPAENVHILYEPDAAGRVAFGGVLVE